MIANKETEGSMCKGKTNLLNLPAYPTRIEEVNGKRSIYDDVRDKWVALTPEEWVRQHFIHYLLEHLHYPKLSITNEARVLGTQRAGRTDTIVFGHGGRPWMLIEYKAPTLPLSREMWHQLSNYNMTYQAPYLVLTNGCQHLVCRIDYCSGQCSFVPKIPSYAALCEELGK